MALPRLGINADLNGNIPFSTHSEWNIRIDKAPLAPNSAKIIAAISPGTGLHADFGSGLWNGKPIGIPYVVVSESQPMVRFTNTLWPSEGDRGPYPIPANAPFEGGGDRHVIVVQRDPDAPNGLGNLYEIYQANRQGSGWVGQGSVFDMQDGDHQRPMGWTSADAAGLPIFPGLARYDEMQNAIEKDGANATLGHALRFTLSQANTAMSFVGMASHHADSIDGAAPFGMHVRLKASYKIPANAPIEVKVILNTLKKYGMILADNGSDWYISGSPHSGWDNDALRVLGSVRGIDFQVIDSERILPGKTANGTAQADVMRGTQGDDRLNGLAGDDKITGSDAYDVLIGGIGNDILNGGRGRDTLFGSAGKDAFVFDTRLGVMSKLGGANVDVIRDFATEDSVHLDNAIFKGIGSGTAANPVRMLADAFHVGRAAADAQDRIIYDRSKGALYYDADGTGSTAMVQFAVVSNKPLMGVADFLVI
ncbi:MAG TPA: calcium-binding protein [Rhizobiaceae bacterium]|nr:calcium-binding protein [Rhizobiaceae bacterium]